MSLTPTDGPADRDSDGQTTSAREQSPKLSGRARVDAVTVSLQRSAARSWRSVRATAKTAVDRLLSPGLASTEREPLSDAAIDPPRCPPIESFPARAFPLTYPTRAYRLVDNDADLVAELDAETLRMFHPEGSDAWIRADTWVDVEP